MTQAERHLADYARI